MVSTSATSIDQPTLLSTVRDAIHAAGGRPITLRKFLDYSGLNRRDIFKFHAGWNELTTAAGFDFDTRNRLLDPARLLADWGKVARKLQRIPSRKQYNIHGAYHPCTLENRYGSWTTIPAAFRDFVVAAKTQKEWKDILTLIAAVPPTNKTSSPRPSVTTRQPLPRKRRCDGKLATRLPGRPIYGAPMDFGSLRRAPVNEQGVIFLFGMLAEPLGFQVEALQSAYPDCEAKRRIGPDTWQTVRIEFEYESKNFRDHGHAAQDCDLIVCWNHNWPDCPLEVIALSEKIRHPAGP